MTHLRAEWAHIHKKKSLSNRSTHRCSHSQAYTQWLSVQKLEITAGKMGFLLLLLLLLRLPPSSSFHSLSPFCYFLGVIYDLCLWEAHPETVGMSGWCVNDHQMTHPHTWEACFCMFRITGIFLSILQNLDIMLLGSVMLKPMFSLSHVSLFWVPSHFSWLFCSSSRCIHHITFSRSSAFKWKYQEAPGYDYWLTNYSVT